MNEKKTKDPEKEDEAAGDFISELEGSLDSLFSETGDEPPPKAPASTEGKPTKAPAPVKKDEPGKVADAPSVKEPILPAEKKPKQKPKPVTQSEPEKTVASEKKPVRTAASPPKQEPAKPPEKVKTEKTVQPTQTVVVVKKQKTEPAVPAAAKGKPLKKDPVKEPQKGPPPEPVKTPAAAEKPVPETATVASQSLPEKKKKPTAPPAETEKTGAAKFDLPEEDQMVDLDRDTASSSRFKLIAAAALILIAATGVYIFFTPAGPLDLGTPPAKQTVRKISPPPAKPVVKIKPASVEKPGQLALPVASRETVPAEKPAPHKTEPAAADKPSVSEDIKIFLTQWKAAWEKSAGKTGDIQTYMSFYSDNFAFGKFDKTGWEKDKAAKNRRKEWIKIELKKIHIAGPLEKDLYRVDFIQDYKSSNYSGVSAKTLILTKEKSRWKILTNQVPNDSYPYSIHAGSFRSIQDAEQMIETYRRMDLQVFRVRVNLGNKGIWYRVLIGNYPTETAAREMIVAKKLENCKPEKILYANLIGTYTSEDRLKERFHLLSDSGYSPYVIKDGIGRHNLYVGAFFNRANADSLNRELTSKKISSKVVSKRP